MKLNFWRNNNVKLSVNPIHHYLSRDLFYRILIYKHIRDHPPFTFSHCFDFGSQFCNQNFFAIVGLLLLFALAFWIRIRFIKPPRAPEDPNTFEGDFEEINKKP